MEYETINGTEEILGSNRKDIDHMVATAEQNNIWLFFANLEIQRFME